MTLSYLQIVERPLCACGCGQEVGVAKHDDRANGYVKGQPFTYRRGHFSRSTKPQYIVRNNGCWEWQRCRDKDGYGHMSRLGVRYLAHRYFYERAKGSVPGGLQLDHLCRNPSCVNPDHLEPVTNAENGRRGKHTKLTAEAVREIRASTETPLALAARYGVSREAVYGVLQRRTWRDV